MRDDPFESRLVDFERAWRRSGPTEIADFLNGVAPAGDLRRLLVELICVDLEFRWKAAGAVERFRLEDYIERFPELLADGPLPPELVGEEYRVRRLWGDRPSHAEFLQRFHERREEIRAELCRVDGEIEREAEPPPAPRSPRPDDGADLGPDVPLLSHRDFRLRRLIGAGGTGKVYEASRPGTPESVAVKFLRKSYLGHPGMVRRFLEEARTVARLRHPNIVGTHGVGRTPAGAYFLVMDLVRGPNLAEVAVHRVVAVDEAVRWALEVCEALEHSHGRGVVHCDLKPANLLLDPSGRIRVTDFGLARSLAEETPTAAEVEGTAPFMAPEQVSRGWGPVDQRTDVYGVGAVLFALLTGRPPFPGRRLPDILAAVVDARPVEPPSRLRPDLPEDLEDLCLKCLAKPPEARFSTIGDVRLALARCLEAES